jgi:Leucine-rich repeat (LRR) protein
MPLKTLYVQGSKISDLSPLKGLPLRELYLEGCPSVADVSALAEIPTLEKLTVPMSARNIEALRQLTQLKMLAFSRNANTLLPSSTVEDFWKDNDANGWLGRLRESGLKANTLNQLDDGTWEVNLDNSAIADLTLLRGAPISRLSISHTPVSDLTPLRNLALKQLWLFETKVTDLSPLTGMPIEVLNLGGTKVSDIAALRGMPLVELSLLTCSEVIDLSPLANVTTLRTLTLSAKAKNFEFLRSMKGLERLSYDQDRQSGYRPNKTAREFWNDYDQKTQAAGKQP